MALDTNHYKNLLLKERETLLNELRAIGAPIDKYEKDWEITSPHTHDTADPNVRADRFEAQEKHHGLTDTLEERLGDVNNALKRIEDGTYGFCTKAQEKHEISAERLDANPAATTCTEHMNE